MKAISTVNPFHFTSSKIPHFHQQICWCHSNFTPLPQSLIVVRVMSFLYHEYIVHRLTAMQYRYT